MKKPMVMLLLSLFLLNLIIGTSDASEERIYIGELVIKNGLQTAKTLISIFKRDGIKVDEVLIDGVMARVSPDGNHIIHLDLKNADHWDIILADSRGRKIRTLDFKRPAKGIGSPRPTNLFWSPDENRLAIVSAIQDVVLVAIYGLKTDHLKTVYSGNISGDLEGFLYTIKWFSDGKRILIAGADGTRILNLDTSDNVLVSNEASLAYLTNNEKKIIYVPQISGRGWNAETIKKTYNIYEHDIEKNTSELIITLDRQPAMAVLSADSRYLVFQNVPIKEPKIFIVDLLKKNVTTMETKGSLLLPKKYSRTSTDLVLCMEMQPIENSIGYGILNLKNGEFQRLKKYSAKGLEGEAAGLVLLMGFDWYDWR
jgi:WD40 repeat protein